MKHRNETCSDIFKLKNIYKINELAKTLRHGQTQTCVKWQKCNSVLKLKQNFPLRGEVGYAIGKLCIGQVTKNCVGGSNLGCCCTPIQASREWEMNCCALLSVSYAIHHVNESMRNRPVRMKLSLVSETKFVYILRKVMQWADCALVS